METPAQIGARLAAALEDLAGREAACVRQRDVRAVIEIQERAAPLIDHLISLADQIVEPGVRRRIEAVVRQRRQTQDGLSSELGRLRTQLDEIRAKQRRAAQVAPTYGLRRPQPSALRGVG